MFNIELHKDDINVLKYIKTKLGIGNIRIYKDKCVFTVSRISRRPCRQIIILKNYNSEMQVIFIL
jgi:hypothetical protein